ncbi:MAG TPA: PD-(D/E)XK nuclease family protein [Streptosporangiaceae bacterium]
MEQLGFEGMPRRLYPCTPSRLRSWLDCPRRYRMTYLDRPGPPKGPPWAHNSLGASVHNALAGWWRLHREERTPEAAGSLLARGWLTDGYASDAQCAEYLRRSRPMVEEYVAGLDPDCEPAGVERTVATKTDLITVSGRIDRLDDRVPAGSAGAAGPAGSADRELVVVDYKTGRSPLTVDDARSSMALALYALAAGRVLRRPCHAVELHHLPTRQVLRWDHTDASLERQLHRAEDIAAECGAADERFLADPEGGRGDEVFPPAPGIGCGWCDFRGQCPQGQAASPARRPWDGLAADEPVVAPQAAPADETVPA